MSEFRPIGDYGLLADCNGAALVDRSGSIDRLCLPRYDSPAVFARILDPRAGHWSIRPPEGFEVERRYIEGTLVLETTFRIASGVARMRDAMAFAPGQRGHDLGLDAPHEVLRLVECLSGRVELEMELAPRPEYGLSTPVLYHRDGGARTVGGPNQVVVSAGVETEIADATMRARFPLGRGERAGFALRWVPAEQAEPEVTPAGSVSERIADVVEGWRSWEADHDIYEGPHREQVRLSSRVLKGLTYRPTGAIVAAPTTSLPETVGGERNWDYRYSWIRDASLTLQALYIGACSDEADAFLAFLANSAGGHVHGEPIQIMYGVGGERDLSERVLGHLRGWRESRPVRVGNGAWMQTQLDVYGELLESLLMYRERLGELDRSTQHFVADLADAAADSWERPDAGMWEMRGEPRHHLSSKLFCWVALDRAVTLAPSLGPDASPDRWAEEAERVRAAILERGWSERGQAYTQSFGSDELDASALLMPRFGFAAASDDPVRSTIERIASELTEDGLVLRYRTTEAPNPDGLPGEEATFVICSFWLVRCLVQLGELDRARTLLDRVLGYSNDLGLLAEQVDAASDELLGSFPQAFSHVGLIRASWDVDSAVGKSAAAR